MHATLSGAVSETRESVENSMPSAQNFQADIAQFADFKKTDPSAEYDITSKYKLGSGGFAKVFKVQRKSD